MLLGQTRGKHSLRLFKKNKRFPLFPSTKDHIYYYMYWSLWGINEEGGRDDNVAYKGFSFLFFLVGHDGRQGMEGKFFFFLNLFSLSSYMGWGENGGMGFFSYVSVGEG
jgi:hypothetical protein